jgi:predicted dehydrogenase
MHRRTFLTAAVGLGIASTTKGAPMSKTYRVAVIGRTGRGDYGHDMDTVWLDIPAAQIIAVADESEAGRERAKERLKAPAAYADYREMLQREKPDLVSIAPRWLDCHRDMALACAGAGVRGVLMEKPLARTLAEADAIVAGAEKAGMKLAIAHQTRYSPRLKKVRELIADGRIGDLLELRARGKEDHRGGGEDLMVLGTHLMDMMRCLAGDPTWCFARVTQDGKPVTRAHVQDGAEGIGPLAGDAITATYGFPNGVTGFFASDRARHGAGGRFGLHVLGSKGQLTLGMGTLPPVYLLEDPSWNPGQSGARWQPVTSAGAGLPEPLTDSTLRAGNRLIVEDLIRSVEENRQPVGSATDGRAALEMILAVYESHRRNAPVDLPLREREHPLSRLE